MGYAIVTGHCIGCGRLFSFNPHRVPSTRAVTGRREPICIDCVERCNPIRIANGLDPITVLEGAYDPIEESEL